MTFSQTFVTAKKQFIARGKWTMSNDFLGPTEVTLLADYTPEEHPPDFPSSKGQRILIVHKEGGHLRLAFNEAAEWYYDRIQ